MTTRLEKTLKRQLTLDGRTFIVTVSPEGLKITLKGKRKGQELRWSDLVSGEAALAVALNASVGRFESPAVPAKRGVSSAPAPKACVGRAAPMAARHRSGIMAAPSPAEGKVWIWGFAAARPSCAHRARDSVAPRRWPRHIRRRFA